MNLAQLFFTFRFLPFFVVVISSLSNISVISPCNTIKTILSEYCSSGSTWLKKNHWKRPSYLSKNYANLEHLRLHLHVEIRKERIGRGKFLLLKTQCPHCLCQGWGATWRVFRPAQVGFRELLEHSVLSQRRSCCSVLPRTVQILLWGNIPMQLRQPVQELNLTSNAAAQNGGNTPFQLLVPHGAS